MQASALSPILFALAIAIATVLLAKAAWLTAAGFSPLWAAFTFPFGALAGAALVMAEQNLGGVWDALAAGSIAAATLIGVFVGYRFVIAAKAGELFRAPII